MTTDDPVVGATAWAAARRGLAFLPEGRGLNIAHEAVDQHAAGTLANEVALRSISPRGIRTSITYAELRRETNRFANALRARGVRRGDAVATLLGPSAAVHVAALGAMKLGAVVSPLFTAFGPEPVRQRLELARARVLVTTPSHYESKVEALLAGLPELEHVLVVDDGDAVPTGTCSLRRALDEADPDFVIPPTDPEQEALLLFTSGTTGAPKGAVHVHEGVVVHRESARIALGLSAGDVFWCTADPGWVTGLIYGVIAPLTIGATVIVDEGTFDPHRWLAVLRGERVRTWYTSPTALRLLREMTANVGLDPPMRDLRWVATVGEPLDPDTAWWTRETFGRPVHDTWWQTETGGIMIANLTPEGPDAGSMGRPLPGVEATVLCRDQDDDVVLRDGRAIEATAGVPGELALRAGWPSMFRGYLGDTARYERCFAGGWYLTGDLVTRDEDGRFWFVGRGDDVIKSAGHLIGPNEVERVLLEHAAVADAGVIGVPDALVGQAVQAVVQLARGCEPSERLAREIRAHARRRLGPVLAPREIAFARELPKSPSGKILRRVLRARALEQTP